MKFQSAFYTFKDNYPTFQRSLVIYEWTVSRINVYLWCLCIQGIIPIFYYIRELYITNNTLIVSYICSILDILKHVIRFLLRDPLTMTTCLWKHDGILKILTTWHTNLCCVWESSYFTTFHDHPQLIHTMNQTMLPTSLLHSSLRLILILFAHLRTRVAQALASNRFSF